jgi:hypothetical protein
MKEIKYIILYIIPVKGTVPVSLVKKLGFYGSGSGATALVNGIPVLYH